MSKPLKIEIKAGEHFPFRPMDEISKFGARRSKPEITAPLIGAYGVTGVHVSVSKSHVTVPVWAVITGRVKRPPEEGAGNVQPQYGKPFPYYLYSWQSVDVFKENFDDCKADRSKLKGYSNYNPAIEVNQFDIHPANFEELVVRLWPNEDYTRYMFEVPPEAELGRWYYYAYDDLCKDMLLDYNPRIITGPDDAFGVLVYPSDFPVYSGIIDGIDKGNAKLECVFEGSKIIPSTGESHLVTRGLKILDCDQKCDPQRDDFIEEPCKTGCVFPPPQELIARIGISLDYLPLSGLCCTETIPQNIVNQCRIPARLSGCDTTLTATDPPRICTDKTLDFEVDVPMAYVRCNNIGWPLQDSAEDHLWMNYYNTLFGVAKLCDSTGEFYWVNEEVPLTRPTLATGKIGVDTFGLFTQGTAPISCACLLYPDQCPPGVEFWNVSFQVAMVCQHLFWPGYYGKSYTSLEYYPPEASRTYMFVTVTIILWQTPPGECQSTVSGGVTLLNLRWLILLYILSESPFFAVLRPIHSCCQVDGYLNQDNECRGQLYKGYNLPFNAGQFSAEVNQAVLTEFMIFEASA